VSTIHVVEANRVRTGILVIARLPLVAVIDRRRIRGAQSRRRMATSDRVEIIGADGLPSVPDEIDFHIRPGAETHHTSFAVTEMPDALPDP
jgi:hypothetical protein